jgi:hypothetical protein
LYVRCQASNRKGVFILLLFRLHPQIGS